MCSTLPSSQAYFQRAAALPRDQLLGLQYVINQALAIQQASGGVKNIPQHPPPPYHTSNVWHSEPLFKPRMDMFESSLPSDSRPLVTATFELPGLRKDDVHIDFIEHNMIITGQRRSSAPPPMIPEVQMRDDSDEPESVAEQQNEGENHQEKSAVDQGQSSQTIGYTVREIRSGKFRRVVPVPAGTRPEDVKACMADGILTVTFPGKPKPVARSIPVV